MRTIATVISVALLAALIAFAEGDEKAKSSTKKPAGSKKKASSTKSATHQATTHPATKHKTATSKTATNKAATTKTGTNKAGAGKVTSKSSSKSNAKQTAAGYRRSSQQQPTAERYREIQQALADKGYFGGAVDGNWGPASVDALKRFQHDQNLSEDGKLGSLSIIALGLGPQRAQTQ